MVAVDVVPAHQHVIDGHEAVFGAVLEDVESALAEDVVVDMAHDADQAAVDREVQPQIGQQVEADVGQKAAKVAEDVPDQGKIDGKAVQEHVLQRPEAEIDAVDDQRGAVEDRHEAEAAPQVFKKTGDVRCCDGEQRNVGQSGQLQAAEQIPQTDSVGEGNAEGIGQIEFEPFEIHAQGEVHAKIAGDHRRDVESDLLGAEVEAAVVGGQGVDDGLGHPVGQQDRGVELVEAHRQGGKIIGGGGIAVPVDHHHASHHAQGQGPDGKGQFQVRAGHPETDGAGCFPARSRVVVVKKNFRVFGIAEIDAGIDFKVEHRLEQDIGPGPGAQLVGEKTDAVQRRHGPAGRLLQGLHVQVQGEAVRENPSVFHVDVEHPVSEGQGKQLVRSRQAVVVVDAQGGLDQRPDLLDAGRRICGGAFDLGGKVVEKRKRVRKRDVEHRQHGRVKIALGKGAVHKVDAHAQAVDDVGEAQLLEIKAAAQIGQDHHDGVGRRDPAGHQCGQVEGGPERVMVDDHRVARDNSVLDVDSDLGRTGQGQGRPQTGIDTQSLQHRRAAPAQGQLQGVEEAAVHHLGQGEAGVAGSLHQPAGGAHVHGNAGPRARTAQGDPQKAKLPGHRKVRHVHGQVGGKRHVFDAEGVVPLAIRAVEVEKEAQPSGHGGLQGTGGPGGQADPVAQFEIEVQRRGHRGQLVGEGHGHGEPGGRHVVGDLHPCRQDAGFVDGHDEILQGQNLAILGHHPVVDLRLKALGEIKKLVERALGKGHIGHQGVVLADLVEHVHEGREHQDQVRHGNIGKIGQVLEIFGRVGKGGSRKGSALHHQAGQVSGCGYVGPGQAGVYGQIEGDGVGDGRYREFVVRVKPDAPGKGDIDGCGLSGSAAEADLERTEAGPRNPVVHPAPDRKIHVAQLESGPALVPVDHHPELDLAGNIHGQRRHLVQGQAEVAHCVAYIQFHRGAGVEGVLEGDRKTVLLESQAESVPAHPAQGRHPPGAEIIHQPGQRRHAAGGRIIPG